VDHLFPIKPLDDNFVFTLRLHVYPLYSRFYRGLLKIPYFMGSRDPALVSLIPIYQRNPSTSAYFQQQQQPAICTCNKPSVSLSFAANSLAIGFNQASTRELTCHAMPQTCVTSFELYPAGFGGQRNTCGNELAIEGVCAMDMKQSSAVVATREWRRRSRDTSAQDGFFWSEMYLHTLFVCSRSSHAVQYIM
jgi:hypothetical protein